MPDAVLSVGIDGSGAEQGSRAVRRSLEDISNSARDSMGAVDRYNSTLGAGGTAAELFAKQTATMTAGIKALESSLETSTRAVNDLSMKFDVVRQAAKSAVTSLQDFGRTKFTGDVTAQMNRLADDMARAMDAGGKGAVTAARAAQRDILTLAKQQLDQQMALVREEAQKRIAGAQEEWERIKDLHKGAKTEIAAQERAAAQQALEQAKAAAAADIATAKAANSAVLADLRSRTNEVIALKQREAAVQAEYERGLGAVAKTEQQLDGALTRLIATEKSHASQVATEAQDNERLLAVVRRGTEAREASTTAITAETVALRAHADATQQAGRYSVSNGGLLSTNIPAPASVTPAQPSQTGANLEQEKVDVLALTDALDKLTLRYDYESAAIARRNEALDTLHAARRVGVLDDEGEYERLRKLVSGEQAQADALVALKGQYSGVSEAQRHYTTEVERVTKILDAAGASDQDRAAILREVAQAYDPAIAAQKKATQDAERLAAENDRLAASYVSLMGKIDPTVKKQNEYEQALAQVVAYHASVGSSTEAMAADMDRVKNAMGPAAIEAQKEADAVTKLLDRLDPTAKKSRELAADQELLRKAMAAEGADVAKLTAAMEKLNAEQDRLGKGTSKGEARMNQQVLGSVGVNTIQSLASGIPLETVAMTQGTQLLTLLQGGSAALLGYAAAAAATVGPVVALGIAVNNYTGSLRELDRVNRLTGNSTGMTTAQIVAQADAAAAAAGISRSAARDLETQYAGTGRIGGQMLEQVTRATKDWAVATRQDMDTASKELAGMFTDPARAAEELTKKYGFFSDAQLQVIKNYQVQGDLEQAQTLLLDGIRSRTQGAAENVAWYAKAWESVSTHISDAADAFARYASDTRTVGQLKAVADKAATDYKADPNGSNWVNGAKLTTKEIADQTAADYSRAFQNAEADSWFAVIEKGNGDFKRLQSSVMDFARSVDPAKNATQAYANAEGLLNNAIKAGATTKDEAARLLKLYRDQLEQSISPAKTFATEMERQARVMEAAAGRARDFEQQRQAVLQKRGAQPSDSLTGTETADINQGLDRKYAAEGTDRHRTAQEAIADARILAAATASLSQPAIIAAQAQAAFNKVIRETTDTTHPLGNIQAAQQAKQDALTKSTIEWSTQVDASVASANLAVAAAQRLAAAQAQGGDIAAAQAQAMNVYAEQTARGVDPTRALALAQAELQKSMVSLAGQQAAWNRDMREQIDAAQRLAQAESVSGAAVAEATIQNKARAQALKEGVGLESDRARAIEAGTRALEAQNAVARVNNSIRQGNQDLKVARAEYDLLGASNAERERSVAILKATLEVQNSADWQAVPQATRDAWIAQAGAVAEYKSRVADATETSRDFANVISKGFEDALLGGEKLSNVFKALAKDIERVFLRSFVTKPMEGWIQGTMTKLLSPTPANDNMVKAVNDNDPGGYRAAFERLGSAGSAAGSLGTRGNPMIVQFGDGNAALNFSAATNAGPMPVAIKDGGQVVDMLRSEARAQGVPEDVVLAVAKIESNFRQYRDDGRLLTSSAGAQGVMQLMPGTAKWLGVDASDTQQNIQGGVKFLSMLGRQFGGNWTNAIAAYNAGPTRVQQHLTQGRALPAEAVTYVERFGKTVQTVSTDVSTMGARVGGVTKAQEDALQAQLDAVDVQRTAIDSTQTLTVTQQSWVDSALGMTSVTKDASSVIEVQSRAVSHIGEGAISAADGLAQAGDSATKFGDAATDGADTFLGGLSKMLGGASDWLGGLFGGGNSQQQKVIKNADGSTSFAPATQGVGGSWLSQPVFKEDNAQRLFDAGQSGSWQNGQWSNTSAGGTTWGQVIQGVGGIASGALTATQKGATAGQKIGGGLMAAGGVAAMIPGGQIVGGVMMAAGALLSAVTGAKDRGEKYSISHITLGENGKYALGAFDQDNGGDPTRFNSDASKVAKGLNDIAARLNLTPKAGDSYIDSKHKSAEQAALELLKGMKSGVPEIAYAIAHESATSLEDMLSHLEFANSFNDQVQALRSSISDLFSQFQTGVDSANTFGASLLDVIDNAQTVFAVSSGAKLPGFARGTVSAPSGWAVVGEEGPEVVRLGGGERIWNARESAQMLAGLGQGRDDTLIHLRSTDELSAVRRALGMNGKVNPVTGLLGFDDSGDGVGSDNSPGGERDTPGSGTSQGDTGSGYGVDSNGNSNSSDGFGGFLDAIGEALDSVNEALSEAVGIPAQETQALAGMVGIFGTAAIGGMRAAAETLGGFLESTFGAGEAGSVSGPGDPGGTASGGGSYDPGVLETLTRLRDVIAADPNGAQANALIGAAAVGGPRNATVQQIADAPWKVFAGSQDDPLGALEELDTAAQQLLASTGQIPDVLQRALDGANAYAVELGIAPATAARQMQEEQAQQKADALQVQFDAVGLVKDRIAELNSVVVSLGDSTFSPIGKDFDALATDMKKAADAYVAAGQSVPDGLFGALNQMEALGAVRKRLLDEVAGVTVETSPEEQKVEQFRGKWSTTATDLVKAFASVGIIGDELAAKLNEGFSNDLRKEQGSYSDSLDTAFRKSKGEEGYDSAVGLIDAYKTSVKDVTALWPEGTARAEQMAKVTGALTNNMEGLVKSGSITSASLQQIITAFGATPEVVNAARAALQALADATAEAARSFNAGIDSRMYAALGNSRGSGLITLDEQQRQELKTAQDAGRDTTQLQQVQAAERAAQAFQLAQQDILAAYDQQISAQQDLISELQEGAVAAAAVARQFRQAYDSLALSDNSPLGAYDKLLEARRQFEEAYSTATSGTATDTEKTAAESLLQQLGPTVVQLANAYFANSDRSDYDRVRAVFDQLGTLPVNADLGTADQQLQAAQDQLSELQKARAEAARIGERQYGAISGLKDVMDQSYAVWQAALGPLKALTGTNDNTPHYGAPAAVQSAWDGLSAEQQHGIARAMGWGGDIDEAFNIWLATDKTRAATFEGNVTTVGSGARYGAPEDVQRAWDGLTQMQQAAAVKAAGYDGGVDAGLNAWVKLGHQAAFEAAVRAAAHTAGVPGFAVGTMSTPPGAVWVGEKGPELLWQGGAAAVASSADSMRIYDMWQSAANDRLPYGIPSIGDRSTVAPTPERFDLSPLVRQVAELTREVKELRAERSKDARRKEALDEQAIITNAAGHERTETALRRQRDRDRAA
ncbi:phage tail length tape measure family protein (plasmid) [Azospirillum sp. HJ39]|uniref:phage tail length tape measure family protein n=1 Tax=Azospirillum sp. HJ39 TaxID=3159496 RepID=UPI0035583963